MGDTMDGRLVSQSSDPTEQGHRSRLSSILKAPRSPLKDLGRGNELCQEPAIDKRRKSSRRVSFAETIRVFTPELQSNGSADKENEGYGTGDSSTNINKGTANKCGIAGMDTLLHGAIQAAGHNADWNFSDCTKERTIVFCSDNDMDMTASNTVTIHGPIEEKFKKIDTSQFLASLKSQNNEEVAKKKDFELSNGVEKHSDFTSNEDSSKNNKIKFSDFLARLGSEKPKATNCLEDAEKENIFPFPLVHFHNREKTENATQMFREQDDGLDLTRCHTTNIDSFFPMVNRETATGVTSAGNGNSQTKRLPLWELSALSCNSNKPASSDQTVFMEDDMDITRSHTTRIRQDVHAQDVQLHMYQSKTVFSSEKTLIFADENEMEMTRETSVLLYRNPSVMSGQRKERVFGMDHTTILPQGEDMDITRSHTVAIDGLVVEQARPQVMSHSAIDIRRVNSGLALNSQMAPSKSLNNLDRPDVGHLQSNSKHNTTYTSKLEDKPEYPVGQAKQGGQNKPVSTILNNEPMEKMLGKNTESDHAEKTIVFACEQDDMELTKSHTIAIDGKHLQEMSKKDNKSYFSGLKLPSVSNKTILFSTDSDDMELTRSHTISIAQKALNQGNKNNVSYGFQQRDPLVSASGRLEKADTSFSYQRVQENTALLDKISGATSSKRKSMMNTTNHLSDDMDLTVVGIKTFGEGPPSSACDGNKTTLFTYNQQDMEITQSHTVFIDSKDICERLQYNAHSANRNNPDLNSAVLKCPNTNIPKEQDGRTVAQEKEADVLSKSLSGLPASCMDLDHAMPSNESSREPCTALQTNTAVFVSDQEDMDVTYSNTAAIRNTLLYGNSKMDKSVPRRPSILKSSAADKTVFEDDMEFTKSHTMVIDERNPIGLCSQVNSITNIPLPTSALDTVVTNPKTICPEMNTSHKISKQQRHNETVLQEGDMEMTNVNAGLLISARKSQSLNNVNPSFDTFKDKTMYLCEQDDMDMTRAHTVAIENKVIDQLDDVNSSVTQSNNATPSSAMRSLVDMKYISKTQSVHDFDESGCTSWAQCAPDMDITVSNTVLINSEKPGNELQLPVSKPTVLSSTMNHYLDNTETDKGNDTVFDMKSRSRLEKNTLSDESQDKTLFLSEQNDMDITKSYTRAIEGKLLAGVKDKSVMEFRNTQPLTSNTIKMADNITSTNEACSTNEEMDMTKSNTVFIDHVSDKVHSKDTRSSDILPKRKSVSWHPKSLVAGDETLLLACNMEETNTNAQLTKSLGKKSSFDKTICNQGDMEMTKSHTVAIEKLVDSALITCSLGSRTMTSCDQVDRARQQDASNDESEDPLVSKPIFYNELSMPPDPKETFLVSLKESELTNLQRIRVLAGRNKDLLDVDETMFPNEQSMDLTKADTAAVEVHFLDCNSHCPSTDLAVVKGDTEVAGGVKVHGEIIAMEQTCGYRNEPIENCRKKSYARSHSESAKSGIFLEGIENAELTQSHTISVDISLLKTNTGACGNAETILDGKSDITVDFVDHKSKEGELTSRKSVSPNMDPNLMSQEKQNSGVGLDRKVESLEENLVPKDKMPYENGRRSKLLEVKSQDLKMTSDVNKPLNCDPSCPTSDSRDHKRPEGQETCVLPMETLTCTQQKYPEMALEKEIKLPKLKGKRVSFHIVEKEIVTKDVTLDQVTQPSVSQREKYEEHQNRTATDQISVKYGCINQASVIGTMQNTENLENNALNRDSEVVSNEEVGVPEGSSSNVDGLLTLAELQQKRRNERRSIADMHLKIKSLAHKWKTSSHHTAPVSSLIEQLPAASQIICPSGSDHVLPNAELPNELATHEKEPINEINKTITRERSLPSRWSVKKLQPKLPNKRASSTSNIVAPVLSSVSEAELQNALGSKALLKTFNVIDDGQCIDEEMLPACPEDKDINGILHYEVPEGAWEELCQEEVLQQKLGTSPSQPKDSMNSQKRARDAEDDSEGQREKKARWKEEILEKDEAQNSAAFKGSDKSYRSDGSTPHASKTMEQTYYSNSSQESRGDGMSVELSSQQYSQMDFHLPSLPWDSGCEQSLWQKFQDGSITVQEFFVLLRIRILIQKPRYSELPCTRGIDEDLTASEILLDQHVYQPKLHVYEEACHTLYQTIEELKLSTELQHKPLVQINSLLWEAMRMCSETELMYFGVTVKNMKSLYSKKSKRIAHEEKVSTYTKLLHTAQTQWEKLRARLQETDALLGELENCISNLETETARLDEDCRNGNCMQIQTEIDRLKSQEQLFIRENMVLEKRKQKVLAELDRLQDEAKVMDKRLQEPSFIEWELVKWTDQAATFIFLYDSLELFIKFGDLIPGESFNNQPCRKISSVTVESQLDDKVAPPSSLLVHRLISQYVEKKGAFHETYKTQNNLPELLSDLSLVVSRCKLLGEELEYIMKWGARYNIVKTGVQSQEVRLLFSSLASLAKFELVMHLSDTYPTVPLACTLNNHIGSIANSAVTAIISKVPVGLWYLTRTVKSIHENLLV